MKRITQITNVSGKGNRVVQISGNGGVVTQGDGNQIVQISGDGQQVTQISGKGNQVTITQTTQRREADCGDSLGDAIAKLKRTQEFLQGKRKKEDI